MPVRLGEFGPLIYREFRTAKVSGLILLDRAFETLATLALGGIAFGYLSYYDRTVLMGWVIVLLALVAFVTLLVSPAVRRIVEPWAQRSGRTAALIAMFNRVNASFSSYREGFPQLAGLTLLATICDFFFAQWMFFAAGAAISLALVSAGWTITGLASLLAFTPGGIGLGDAPAIYLYRQQGIAGAHIGAAYLVGRVVTIIIPWLGLLVAALWQRALPKQLQGRSR